MAKNLATQMQCEIIDRCPQVFGGCGYITEYPIARMYAAGRCCTPSNDAGDTSARRRTTFQRTSPTRTRRSPGRRSGGFRNILVHQYFGVDVDVVRDVLKADLPPWPKR
jgi:hypothetical protein